VRMAFAALALTLHLAFAASAGAHDDGRPAALRDVEFEQKLNQAVPLGLAFRDEAGNTVRLGDYISGKPVILNFIYFKCRDLCPMLLDGLVRSLRTLAFDVGKQFDVLTVSFDPSDTAALAAAKRTDYLRRYGRPGAEAGWHFLTGDQSSIQRLTRSVGFRYTYDARTGEFGHATGIVLLTPQGVVSRYFYGIDFSPRDLRLALIEAASGKIGSPIDQLLLFCYHYDPLSGKYTLLVTRVMQIAAVATVAILIASFIFLLRRERAVGSNTGRAA
jgi:protein SCO1